VRALLAFAVVAIAWAAIVYSTRDHWTPSLGSWAAKRFAGLTLEIESARWSGLHRLDLQGVHVAGSRDTLPVDARIDAIGLDLDARELLRGRRTALRSIRVDGARGLVDLSTEASPRRSDAPPSPILTELPRGLPAIEARGVELDVRLPSSRSIALNEATLRLEPGAGDASIDLAAKRIEYRDPDRRIERPFAMRGNWYPGKLEFDRLEIDTRYIVHRASLELPPLATGEIHVAVGARAFGGEHVIDAVIAHGKGSLRGSSKAVELAEAAAALASDAKLELDGLESIAGNADLDFDVVLPLDAPNEISGRVRIDAIGFGLAERSLDWLRADLSADARGWRAREVFAVQGANVARVSDVFVPRGALVRCELASRISGAFEAELEDLPALLAEVGEPAVALHPHRASLRGWIADGTLVLGGGSLSVTGGDLTIDRGRVPLTTEWRTIASDPVLDLRMHARFDDVASLTEIVPLPELRGRLEASVGIAGGAQGLHGWADLQAEDLRIANEVLGSVAGHCDLARNRLDLEHMMVVGPDASLDVRGRYTFGEERFEGLRVRGWLRDASVLHVDALPRGGLEVDADISGRWPEIDGRVLARAGDLSTQALGAVRAEVSAHSTRGRLDLDELSLESRYGHITVRGEAGTLAEWMSASGSKCLRLDALEWKYETRRIALAEPVDIELPARGWIVNGLELAGDGVSARGDFRLDGANGTVRTSVRATGIDPWIAPFVHDVRCARLDLDLDASWSPADVEVAVKGKAGSLQVGSEAPATDVELSGSLKQRRATIEKLSVVAVPASPAEKPAEPREPQPADENEPPLVFTGEFPLDLRGAELLSDGPIRLEGAFEIPDLARVLRRLGPNPRNIAGSLRANLDLEGSWSAPRGTVRFDAANLSWTAKESEQTFGPCSLSGEIDLDRDLSIKSLTLDLPAGVHAEGSGKMQGPFDLRRALHGDVAAWRELPLELAGHLEATDLSRITAMVPSLRRLGGKLRGDVGIKGTLAAPQYSGELNLSEGELRTASALPALSGITAKLVLDGERVRLDDLHGEMGGAPFSLGGNVSPFGADPSVDLALDGQHLLLFRTSGLRVRANARLAIKGPVRAMTISGDLVLDDSRFTRDFDFLTTFGPHSTSPPLFSRPLFELPAPFDTAALAVKIDATGPFTISNNVLNGGLRPNLQLVGTGALPILRGTIVINPTSVSLPSGKITTRSGTVEFLPSAPFAPNIDALADTRMQGYDIKIHLSGTIENPVVDLSSVPPLPHEDLLLLVLTGTVPRQDQKSPTGMEAAKTVAVYFANDVVSGWFRGKGGDATDSDFLEVETGKEASQTGVESATARLRVWKGIFSQNSSLYVTGERDIYDRYNFGLRVLFRFR
jgi:hypothetical protein